MKKEMIHYYELGKKFPELLAVSTTRYGGVSRGNYSSLNLCSYTGDYQENVNKNKQIFCDESGIDIKRLYFPRQRHTSNIKFVDKRFLSLSKIAQGKELDGIDALITNEKNIFIGINTADCVPVFLFDPAKKVTGIVHSGWKGTLDGITTKAVREMQKTYNCNVSDIYAIIGISISAKNYEVSRDLYEKYAKAEFPVSIIFSPSKIKGRYHLDLKATNRLQLQEEGIPLKQIEISDICSKKENKEFFSARILGADSGRTASVIGIKE